VQVLELASSAKKVGSVSYKEHISSYNPTMTPYNNVVDTLI
jgi:hypothetical protein